MKALTDVGVNVVERVPLQVRRNPYNDGYLNTKASKLGHLLPRPPEALISHQDDE